MSASAWMESDYNNFMHISIIFVNFNQQCFLFSNPVVVKIKLEKIVLNCLHGKLVVSECVTLNLV